MHFHIKVPQGNFNITTVSKRACLWLPFLFCTVLLFGSSIIEMNSADYKKETYVQFQCPYNQTSLCFLWATAESKEDEKFEVEINPGGVPENDSCKNSEHLGELSSSMYDIVCLIGSNLSASPALFDTSNIQNPANNDIECEEEPVMEDMAGVWFEFTTDADAGRIDVILEHENEVYIGFLMYEVTGDCDDEMIIRICERNETGYFEFEGYDIDPETNYRIFIYTDKEDAGLYELCINVKPPKVCEVEVPNYYNHSEIICGLYALEQYCMIMEPPFPPAEIPWPGCDSCCNFTNPQWFTFIVNDDEDLSVEVFISECQDNQGVQIAMYELDCEAPFDPTQQIDGIHPSADQLVSECSLVSTPQMGTVILSVNTQPGKNYGIVVNGWESDQCKVEVMEVLSAAVPEQRFFDPRPLWDEDTICAGATNVPFTLVGRGYYVCTYMWTVENVDLMKLDTLEVEDQSEVLIDFPEPGEYEICVFAVNKCEQSDSSCIKIEVMDGNAIIYDRVRDTLCHLESYSWYTSTGEFVMELPPQEVSGEVVYETYLYANQACPMVKGELLLQVLSPDEVELVIDDVSCYGGSDGAITDFSVSGGLAPYDLILDGNSSTLEAGIYQYTIVDSWGCELEGEFEVYEPEELDVDIVEMGDSGPGNDEGYVNIEATGGTEPYSFEWRLDGELVSEDGNLSGAEAGLYTLLVIDSNGCETTVESVEVEMGVGFEDLDRKDIQLSIFPNPAGNQIRVNSNFDLGEVRMTLYDIQGLILRQDPIQLSPAADLNVSDLSAGVYFIQIALNKGVHTQKFVKF
jgi:hypothetical protein